MVAALLACAALIAGCSPDPPPAQDSGTPNRTGVPTKRPAAQVPTHVLTEDMASRLITGEQGDYIEVKLDEKGPTEGSWLLASHSGEARLVPQGETTLVHDQTGMKRVFRFRAGSIGEAELVFAFHVRSDATNLQRTVTFKFQIR